MGTGDYYESEYESAMLELLASLGWVHTCGNEMHRKYQDILIRDDMLSFLQQQYPDLTASELDGVILNLSNTGEATEYLSLRATASLCVNGFTLRREDLSLPNQHVDYIDFEHPQTNIFRAVNQLTIREGKAERRPDILLFVNGIPFCIIELKNPVKQQASIYSAWVQIHVRYRRDIPSLMKYCLLSCISDGGSTRLGTTFAPFEHYYAWKKVDNEDDIAAGLGELQTLVNGALAPERFLAIIRDFVYFPDIQEGQQSETEVVCRYPQFFAVKKLLDSILSHLRANGGDGKGGTYFGATGCGKTYTMLFLARQLLRRTKLAPTILVIVDREDLESQASKLFEASTEFLGDASIRSFDSRNDLKSELTARQSGGVFVTTVQKFCETTGLLSERSNIICFSDEAHRTQLNLGEKLEIKDGSDGGQVGAFAKFGFAQYLHDALPNATFVGFTGTPIEDTLQVFGSVVDKYTMKQAVADGITVPLKYEPRLARILLDTEKAKEIEAYYAQCESDGAVTDEVNRSRRAMSKLEVILSNDERLEHVAADIAMHYESYVSEHLGTESKAMVVTSTRQIAYCLHNKLKVIRPDWFVPKRVTDESVFDTPEKKAELESYQSLPLVNIVATRGSNDLKEMFELLGDKTHRQMLDREFKKPHSNFRIAIVVDMWITGFDVPCLSVLYNDKPLQRHTLIQTISRVNRTYPSKEYGVIVDYIGIRQNMQQALRQYGGDEEMPADTELTYTIFVNELRILQEMLVQFDVSDFFNDDPLLRLRTLQRAAEFVLAHPAQNKTSFNTLFKGHVKHLKSAYGILQPAGRLNKEEVRWAQFFMAVKEINGKTTNTEHYYETMNIAVEKMVSQALQCSGIETVLNAQGEEELFSEEFTEEIERLELPHTKFHLLVKLLKKAIREYSSSNQLKAKSFDERLQQVVNKYNNRDNLSFTNKATASQSGNAAQEMVAMSLSELTDEVLGIFRSLRKDREEFKRLGITAEEKAFYDILIDQRDTLQLECADEKCLDLAREIKKKIDYFDTNYSDWLQNNNLMSNLHSDLTLSLIIAGYPLSCNEEIFDKVKSQINSCDIYYS